MYEPNSEADKVFVKNIQANCLNFMEKHDEIYVEEILRFEIPIKVGELLNENPRLGTLVLNSPAEAAILIKAIVYALIISKQFLPANFQDENLIVVPRYSWFPMAEELQLKPSQFAKASSLKHYFTIKGIITSISYQEDYTMCAQYKCANMECNSWMFDRKHIRLHIPGLTEWDLTKPRFGCLQCNSNLVEDQKARLLGKKVIVTLIATESLSLGFEDTMQHKLNLCIRDELIDFIEIGQAYLVIGFPVVSKDKMGVLDVNNLIISKPYIEKMSLKHNAIANMSLTLKDTPWSCCLNLAYYFCRGITSPGFLLKVKLGLLLSLVGIDEEGDWKNASILVIADDNLKIERFYKYASQFCQRQVYHESNNNLAASFSGGVECGSLELAKNGVCVVNVGNLSKAYRELLSLVLNKGFHQVTKDVEKRTTKLKCRVWGSYENFKRRKNNNKAASNFSDFFHFETSSLSNDCKTITESFALVYSVGSPEDDDFVCQREVEHCLNKAMGILSESEELIPEFDWVAFISTAANLQPTLTKEAKDLLTEYFVTTRNASTSQASLPLSVMPKSLFLAKAFAKLCLSTEIESTHAIMAIYLLEEISTSLIGYSNLMVKPDFSLRSQRNDHEEKFLIFKKNLLRNISFNSSQCLTLLQEE